MAKKKLFEDIKQNPARIYRTPGDVLRDRRFGDAERLEILRAWRDAKDDPAERNEIDVMIAALDNRSTITLRNKRRQDNGDDRRWQDGSHRPGSPPGQGTGRDALCAAYFAGAVGDRGCGDLRDLLPRETPLP